MSASQANSDVRLSDFSFVGTNRDPILALFYDGGDGGVAIVNSIKSESSDAYNKVLLRDPNFANNEGLVAKQLTCHQTSYCDLLMQTTTNKQRIYILSLQVTSDGTSVGN